MSTSTTLNLSRNRSVELDLALTAIHVGGVIGKSLLRPFSFPSQLKRTPRPFPTLKLAREVKEIDDFRFEDFIIQGYKPHPKIQMDMAV